MENKNKTAYIWILVVVVLGFFVYAMWKPSTNGQKANSNTMESSNQPSATPENNAPETSTPPTTMDTSTAPSTAAMGETKEITLTANNFKFDMNEIKVKKGDTIKLTLKNIEGFHDWRVDEFKANTKVLKAGESETITFVADKSGTFEYYCSVGQHRAMGMKGNLIVE
jgi:cytochrome c oxidase subunit II